MFDDYEAYLEIEYTSEGYDEEIERMSSLKAGMDVVYYEEKAENDILYTEDYFVYPAYVECLDNDLGVYSYALVDEENYRIMYIYIDQIMPSRIRFDKEYLPQGYVDSTCGYSELEYSMTGLY